MGASGWVPTSNGCFRLPTSTATKAVGVEVQRAIAKYHEHRSERERPEALSHHMHCHLPTCPGCTESLQAKMPRGDGVQGPKQMKKQIEMGFDLMGPMVKSPDGNVYKLVGVATGTGVGWAVGLPDKTAEKVLDGVKVILARTRLLHTYNDDVTVRFHSDLDKSFMEQLKNMRRTRCGSRRLPKVLTVIATRGWRTGIRRSQLVTGRFC